ncbi:MAG: hypothetical protein HY885_01580 [Deltaproteobacteria bacterium]|nr:hypothetical protein [Deltaproteobacteria bacterium]
MKLRIMLMLAFLVFAFASGESGAKEVRLGVGETYREGDLSIICGEANPGFASEEPVMLKECQHWDDFHKKCLFEQKIYTYNDLECIEECQHWDSFHKTCDYQTRCAFHRSQGAFVRTSCDEFDDYSRKCLKSNETKIGGSGRGRH